MLLQSDGQISLVLCCSCNMTSEEHLAKFVHVLEKLQVIGTTIMQKQKKSPAAAEKELTVLIYLRFQTEVCF